MIKIIDSTLAMLDDHLPTKEKLLLFCTYMKSIGILDLEISQAVYEQLEVLPEGFRFYLYCDNYETVKEYYGVYKYISHNIDNFENGILEIQINDIREIIQIRNLSHLSAVRIIGLDDLILHNYVYVMEELRKIFKKAGSNLIFCPENTYHCATGLAVQWILNGGKTITTSFGGYGGRAATEEVMMGLRVSSRYKPNQDLKEFLKIKSWVMEITKKKYSRNKPVIGESIFHVESGVHVDGILKNQSNYEAYPPEAVGQVREIILGKHSGINSLRIKLKELFPELLIGEEQEQELLYKIKCKSMRENRSLNEKDIKSVVKEVMFHEG